MYLTSITQRDRLFDVATRWLGDRPEPGDGRFATQVFIYESVIWAPLVRRFVADILRQIERGPVALHRFRTKDQLRHALCAGLDASGPRGRELCGRFRDRPEEFFPGTPVDLVLAARPDGWPLGMVRIKRVRRIAEKASRRVADGLAGRIHAAARDLAGARAAALRLPLETLGSTPDAMLEDFAEAERKVSRALRDEVPAFAPQDLRVDDVIGIKFVGTPTEVARLERAIGSHELVAEVAREEHRGRYNDVNLLVDLTLPEPATVIADARRADWAAAAGRGLGPETLAREFPAYVEGGARTVRAEVILTTWEELVESEFGRSIHEQRILEQRRTAAYSGRIASNASFLIQYLLMLAISPKLEVATLPVKMWGQYLPDIYALAVWDLFGIRLGLDLVPVFAELGDSLLLERRP